MRRGPIVAWLLSIAAVACGEPSRLPATAPSGSAGSGGSVGGAVGAGGAGGLDGSSAGAAGASAGGTGAAGTGGASAGAIQYAGTDVNPINSGDGVVFRRIDVRNTLCVLVSAFILPGGQVQPPITAFALPADAATCLTATTANHVAATNVTGTVGSSDGGRHFGIDLHLTFPGGMDWLAPVIDFQADNLPLDGVWYPAP